MDTYNPNEFGRKLSVIGTVPVSLYAVGTSITAEQKLIVLKRTGHEGLLDLEDIPEDILFLLDQIDNLSISEAIGILRQLIRDHEGDMNFPSEDYERIKEYVEESESRNTGEEVEESPPLSSHEKLESSDVKIRGEDEDWSFLVRLDAALLGLNSPYPEIRAVTDPYDDPSIPVETIRAYILGLGWTCIGTFVTGFFAHRQPSISLPSSVVQILLYPCGELCAFALPDWGFTLGGVRHSLNPGPWSQKEQLFSTIIYSVSASAPWVLTMIMVQKLDIFYGQSWVDWGYEVLLTLSTQCLGFGFAGVLRRFVVYPTRAVWPTLLPVLALNRALLKPEKRERINGWTISRYYFFVFAFVASFVYFWVPNYLFEALSTFNWMTWIRPDNYNLAAITGSFQGLGLNPVPTFDLNMMFYLNNPLALPFFTQINQYIGMLIGFFVLVGVYWSNFYWTGYLPINNNALFTNTGSRYNITRILDSNTRLDAEKYNSYSPAFYTAGNLVNYGSLFALYPFGIIYTVYSEWYTIKYSMTQAFKSLKDWKKSQFEGFNDPHSKMMENYPEVPDWCFLIILVISFVFGVILVKVYPETDTPVWTIVFALAINFVFLIPLTIITCVTGFSFGLNVLVELVIGYALPGNGVALMLIKSYGYNIDAQAQTYIADQKMGHYGKIPPRALFRGQILSTIISLFIHLGVLQLLISTVDGLCEPLQPNKFTCPNDFTQFSASIIWGVIGPKRVFNTLYPLLAWCFLIGALLVIPCALFKRYGPKHLTKYFHPTVMIGGVGVWTPYNLSHLTGSVYLSIAFMYYIKKKYLSWWEKYNYILAAGILSGIAFSGIIVFFSVQYHPKNLNWWGNTVSRAGIDGGALKPQTRLDVKSAPDGYFGPRIGHFP